MPCCGKRCKRNETDVERTQRVLKNVLVTLLIMNVAHAFAGFAGLLMALGWTILFAVALRASQMKNERTLRAYVSITLCLICCGLVFGFMIMASMAHHHHNQPQEIEGPMQPEQQEQPEMMVTHNPKVMMHTKPAPEQPQQRDASDDNNNNNVGNGNMTIDDLPADDEHHGRRHHGNRALVGLVFFGAAYEMIFFSLKIASLMLAARLARFLKVERLSAPAMMMPADAGDVALEPMASTGAPQVFYMPTADGKPQYIVYSPVEQA